MGKSPMSEAATVISVLLQLTQLAANMGLSMQDLVARQKAAELEGREFGEQDLIALRAEVEKNLTELENS